MHTRHSPVRRSSAAYCYALLPLDLHVLGLPLAFILSQDQTLRCNEDLLTLLFFRILAVFNCVRLPVFPLNLFFLGAIASKNSSDIYRAPRWARSPFCFTTPFPPNRAAKVINFSSPPTPGPKIFKTFFPAPRPSPSAPQISPAKAGANIDDIIQNLQIFFHLFLQFFHDKK